MAWTDYDDVFNRWVGGGFPASESQVLTLIEDAEDTIRQEFPDIDDRLEEDADHFLPVERVIKVTARMVIRHLRNPTGTRSTSHGAGPFQQSITYGGEEPGTMYLTDADRSELSPNKAGKAFTVDTTPQPYEVYQPESYLWEPIR